MDQNNLRKIATSRHKEQNLHNKFKWFDFNDKWDLLVENQENTIDFLKSLDIYVYNSHYKFVETQCRATIEAMLTGLPVVAPLKFNFSNLYSIIHQFKTRFL